MFQSTKLKIARTFVISILFLIQHNFIFSILFLIQHIFIILILFIYIFNFIVSLKFRIVYKKAYEASRKGSHNLTKIKNIKIHSRALHRGIIIFFIILSLFMNIVEILILCH